MPDPTLPAPPPLVSILIISYNTKAMTLACLASIAAETSVAHEVIVLDNASPDGSAAAIAEAHPGIRLIASATNHGFAQGNNLAAAEARGRYLLLLNPDTLVLDRAIDRLAGFAERVPEAGIWGGRTVFPDGSLNPMSVFGDQTLWSVFCRTSGLALAFKGSPVFNPEEYGAWPRDSERAVDAVQGCFFLIRRELWDALGGFDARFVMYGEEADLCRRARARGAAPRMTPAATIVHYAGAASRLRSDKAILVLKARITLARRHLPAWQRPLAVGLIRLWPLSRSLGGTLLGRLTGRRRGTEAAAHWGAVWRARADWRDGFPALPHPGPGGVSGMAEDRPDVSIVVPHLNQPDYLAAFLASLYAQDFDMGRAEVIVVDNGSRVLPEAVVAPYPAVRLVAEPTPGPGPARNRGAALARAPLLVFADADCKVAPDWLPAILARFAADPGLAVLGGTVRVFAADPARPCPAEAYEAVYAFRQRLYIERQGFSVTANMAMRREVFDAVGGFGGIGIAEDNDWGERAGRMGHVIVYAPEVLVHHPARNSIADIEAKWARLISHHHATEARGIAGHARWTLKAFALAASPVVEIPRILASDRLATARDRRLAIGAMTAIRLFRARRMMAVMLSPAARTGNVEWNRR